jgi:hypothetical protein
MRAYREDNVIPNNGGAQAENVADYVTFFEKLNLFSRVLVAIVPDGHTDAATAHSAEELEGLSQATTGNGISITP